jgi:hydroxyacylglutathione hydrolase
MIFEFFQTAGDNLCYLVGDRPAGSAILIDPVSPNACLSALKAHNLKLIAIINTHTHPDHTAGNNYVIKETKAPLAVHKSEADSVGANVELEDGESVEMGALKAKILHTPGHTVGSICVLVESVEDESYIFTGDTLFLAGCGNTRFGGNIKALFESLTTKLMTLEDNIIVCPGHDYAVRNLQFSLSRESDNKSAEKKLEQALTLAHEGKIIFSTIGEEKSYNPFFRFRSQSIIAKLKTECPDLGEGDFQVFAKLRELRNSW